MMFRIGVVLLAFCAALPATAQDQRPRYDQGWPCSGRVDPTFVRSAEATGGKVLLFAPTEVSGAAEDMRASMGRDATIFRTAGQLEDDIHEFDVPIDSTIESAYFFVSLQCLREDVFLQPSGEVLSVDAPGVSYRAFQAIRLLTVDAPQAGTWTVKVAGRGWFSVIVKAKTNLTLAGVSLSRDGKPIRGLAPLGQPVRFQASVIGASTPARFQFISMSGAPIRTFEPELERETDASSTYVTDLTLPESEFRVLMTGIDAHGFRFQRVTPGLFVADR